MKKLDLTKVSVFKGLVVFSLPIFFVYFLNYLYTAADIFILSLAKAEEEISAVMSAYTPINLCIALLTGIGVASTFLIAQYVGGHDEEGRKKAIKTVIIFTMGVSLVLTILVASFSSLIIKGLNIDSSIQDKAFRYLLIQCLIIPLNGLIYTTHAIYKGHGKSVLPFIYNCLGVTSNVIFDFVFIYFLKMGSDGAAIASLLAYIVAAFCIYSYMLIFKWKFKNPLKGVKSDARMYRQLAKHSFPLAIQEALVIICFIVLVSTINVRGIDDSNAIAISDRITNMAYVPIFAFGNTISAAVAQNLGAGNAKRANQFVWIGVLILCGFGLIYCLPIFLFIVPLSKLYTNSSYVIQMIYERSWVVFLDLILCIILTPLNGLASGSGNSKWSLYSYLISDIAIRIPLILIFGFTNMPIWVVSISYPASSVLGLIILLIFYFKKKWKNLSTLPINQDQIQTTINQ